MNNFSNLQSMINQAVNTYQNMSKTYNTQYPKSPNIIYQPKNRYQAINQDYLNRIKGFLMKKI